MKIMLKRNLLDRMVVGFTMQSVPITTDVVSSNLDQGKVSTLCDKVCQWRVTGQWFSLDPPVSSINKTDCHDKAEILLKGVSITIKTNKQKHNLLHFMLKLLIYIYIPVYDSVICCISLMDWSIEQSLSR